MSGHHKNKALLFSTVGMGLVFLLQVSCKPDRATDDPESNLIDPDKFSLELEDVTQKRNLVTVKITPGSPGMNLGEFFVTASLSDNQSGIKGSSAKMKKGFVYNETLNNCHLEKLFLTNKQSGCLGKDDTHFAQGGKVAFRIEVKPGASVKQGDKYTLTVKVERKGSHPHIETESTVLTAQQDGVDTNTQTEEANSSGTSSQTIATAPGTVPGNATPPTSHLKASTDFPIPAGEQSPSEECPQTPVSDPSVPSSSAVSEKGQQHTESDDNIIDHNRKNAPFNNAAPSSPTMGVRTTNTETSILVASTAGTLNNTAPDTDTADSTNADSANDSQECTSDGFSIMLKDVTRSNGVKNFVLVTIKPKGKGMALSDFLVTASFSGIRGIAKGSSGQKGNSFVYKHALDQRNLGELFLTNPDSKCLGKDDTHFAQGEEVKFRIEVEPGASVRPSDQLTVTIAYRGSNPHTETKSIALTAPQASPSKGSKRTSPRK